MDQNRPQRAGHLPRSSRSRLTSKSLIDKPRHAKSPVSARSLSTHHHESTPLKEEARPESHGAHHTYSDHDLAYPGRGDDPRGEAHGPASSACLPCCRHPIPTTADLMQAGQPVKIHAAPASIGHAINSLGSSLRKGVRISTLLRNEIHSRCAEQGCQQHHSEEYFPPSRLSTVP